MNMYYYVLRVTNLVAKATMATMCLVNVVNKLKEVKKKDIPFMTSHFMISHLNIQH